MELDANDLILFAHVVDSGSFARAAERVGLPKSTLSRRLGALESRLGERLLTRSTRRLSITEFGERILDHARRLQEETEAAAAIAQYRQGTPRGVLRVSMPPDFRELDLTPILRAETDARRDLLYNGLYDTHLNQRGAEVVANALARWLQPASPSAPP